MTYIIFFLITTIFHIILLNNSVKIANYLNLNDNPDYIRKFQKKPIPLIGGAIICLALVINLFFLKTSEIYFSENTFIYFMPLITIIGLIDDKYDLSASLKFFFTIIFFILFFYFNKDLIISELRFSSFSYVLNINPFLSIPFTILCCLLLTNSINMIDGKNGLCSSIQIVILFFLAFYIIRQNHLDNNEINFKNENLVLIFLYTLFLIIFLFYNIKGSIFLGDAGTYLGSFVIIYLVLDIYSSYSLLLNSEQIFFLLILPGIDMFRVFIVRLLNKKNPFKADTQHLHNLIAKKIKSHKKITIIISFSLFIPNLIIIIFPTQMLLFLVIYLFIYLSSLRYLYKSE